MAWSVLPLAVGLSVLPAMAQSAGPAQIVFTYENPKLQPSKYVLTVGRTVPGTIARRMAARCQMTRRICRRTPRTGRSISPKQCARPCLRPRASNKLFAIACDDGAKNIAFQGTKTLQYEGPEGHGSCTYNWSKSSQIGKLTDQFQAIAATLDEGSKLQRQYEHARLSLDTELEFLVQMVQDKRAIEVENIAPILRTLAGDDAVLKRVQRRARALLAGAKRDWNRDAAGKSLNLRKATYCQRFGLSR